MPPTESKYQIGLRIEVCPKDQKFKLVLVERPLCFQQRQIQILFCSVRAQLLHNQNAQWPIKFYKLYAAVLSDLGGLRL